MRRLASLLVALWLTAIAPNLVNAQVRNVDQYPGATAGVKMAACISDLPNGGTCDARGLSGGQVISETIQVSNGITLVLPPPTAATFTVSANPAFNVNSASDVTIMNGRLVLSGVEASAVTYTGTVSNLRIEGMTVVGSKLDADLQQGFWCASGQTLSNIRILNNTISGVILGISINANLGGSINGFLISGNHLSDIVGVLPGRGYGIHHANGSGSPSNGRIAENHIETAQRHSIYQARGSGVAITGNTIRDHRLGISPTGAERAAIVVSRSQDITVSGNVIENSLGGAMEVDTDDSNFPLINVILANNIVRNVRDFYPITIGSSNPNLESFPTDVTLIGNHVYQDASVPNSFGGSILQVFSGKRIQISNNYFAITNALSTGSIIQIRGSFEQPGSAAYTDEITVKGNYLYSAGIGTTYGIEFASTAATSGLHAYFSDNRTNVTGNAFLSDTALTDPNIVVTNMPLSGLDPSIIQTQY